MRGKGSSRATDLSIYRETVKLSKVGISGPLEEVNYTKLQVDCGRGEAAV